MVADRDTVEQVLQATTVEGTTLQLCRGVSGPCVHPCHLSQTKVGPTPENSGSFLLTSWTHGAGSETRRSGHSLRSAENLFDPFYTSYD